MRRFPALAGVDLDVEAGDVVLLSGANASGKTTLLRLLARLYRLHSGTAEVLAHELAIDRRGARRAIGPLDRILGYTRSSTASTRTPPQNATRPLILRARGIGCG